MFSAWNIILFYIETFSWPRRVLFAVREEHAGFLLAQIL